ncbi:uncharacterized protein BDV17DRAFT_275783 [Aspergillus undulatus]|uniref:uncharacterized protein n=1 Tax=Aspergillus undulatus TaxID=1810928 RepID=UPI003CCD74A4
MPPRRPVSPLELEICPPDSSDHDGSSLAASDDELDESQLAARRRRIEKLGEAYLKGAPLFILSASLRGPLGKDWVNPWTKDRRKVSSKERGNGPAEQPVIPETNSRKRRQHQDRSIASPTKSSDSPRKSPRTDFVRHDSRNRAPGLGPTATNSQSPHFPRHRPIDTKWLKKDKVSTRFHIDPPTSPTTSISSRYLKKSGATSSHSNSRPGSAGHESAPYEKSQQAEQIRRPKTSLKPELETSDSPLAPERRTPGSNLQKDGSQSFTGVRSVHVVSSSSQLQKFEYRLKRGKYLTKEESQPGSESREDSNGEANAPESDQIPQNGLEERTPRSPSAHSTIPDQPEADAQEGAENSLNSTNASNNIGNPSSTDLDKDLTSNPKHGTKSENNLPSAQPAPKNPAVSDNLTSLYSIAASKSTSNRTDDHNVDQQFSTQAALLIAQRSFQNDLTSPEYSPVIERKRRASQGSNHQSPNAANITPFHKMNAPERETASRPGAFETERAQTISTQYMIDAATPFTFSTEKKAEFRTISPEKDRSKSKKRKTTSFAQSSPSEIASEHFTSDGDDTANILEEPPAETRSPLSESHLSALQMTLTGTTPPTAQEGQAVESFNLSQAIAEAGSWLQQSFDINKDITRCQTANMPQPYPTDSAQ